MNDKQNGLIQYTQTLLQNYMSNDMAYYISYVLLIIMILLLGYISSIISKKIILVRLKKFIEKTKIKWDDLLLKEKVVKHLVRLIPAIIIYFAAYSIPDMTHWIHDLVIIYIIFLIVLTINSILNTGIAIYQNFEVSKERPIKSYVQLIKIFLYIIAFILIISNIIGKSPVVLLTSIGAMTAILLLVFKDTILGLVAGFQIVSNNMIHIGDWIEVPKYGADGNVTDISLTTVKVQNWDKTISSVPVYSLVMGSFKNWRGMSESEGRRIKRAINIDINSIKFCSEKMINEFENIHYLKNYIKSKKTEIDNYNHLHNIMPPDISSRQMTNIGVLRAYIISYLSNHPKIHNDMTFIIRQLAPKEYGVPIEIYVFSNDQEWANYESIQGDIFDHILAVIPKFELKVFQNPTGNDFKSLSKI